MSTGEAVHGCLPKVHSELAVSWRADHVHALEIVIVIVNLVLGSITTAHADRSSNVCRLC